MKKPSKTDYATFLEEYPSYQDTSPLDQLRKREFNRLDRSGEVYVDYMGGCIWPKSLVSTHSTLLKGGLFGNTHSDSPWCVNFK